ncbi:ATP-binding protein [Flavobacterium sp. ST-75]|uniref:Oxygen sensor histidine kinase NreB n=1 Tax=Flavobacterium rhizophilum TaxID=3163296 RepID=A0ABW8YE34_9FLAO
MLIVLPMSICYSQDLSQIEKKIYNNKELALQELNKLDTSIFSDNDKAKYFYLKGEIYDLKNFEDKAFQNYIISKKLYQKIDSIEKAVKINLKLANIIKYQKNNSKISYQKYLDEYVDYFKNSSDSLKYAKALADIATFKLDNEEDEESFKYFKTALSINQDIKNKKLASLINTNLAVIYNEYLNKPDSALYYLNNDIPYLNEINDYYGLSINYTNQAASYYYKNNHQKAIELLNKANSLPIKNYIKGTKASINYFLSVNYYELGDYKKAYESYLTHQTYQDSINEEKQNIAINDIQTKYQTRETELKNEVLTAEVKTGKILVYIFIGLLIASLVIGFLIIKNARRRVYISKQEKLIEQQKLEKALKEFELNSIDLMLEGQEKERERIANDLHDNLGSMLATLKMNFEHLRMRKNEIREEEDKLYDRTDQLIEDAYQKVRTIAHAKNAGVFANEGLIPAIRKMAGKISIPGTLTIEVLAVGFNKRLENKIEIAIFRMVQELSTNIIKHSKATEASIQLTNHDDNINIIIEDNGVGFKSTTAPSSNGMGLNTITKKVEQLGGTFTIDSTPGKGTTIIIDLPI